MAREKRRIKFHRTLSLVTALVLALVIAFVVYEKSGLLSYQISNYVNDHYFRGTPFRFSCGKISGNFVDAVSFRRPAIRYQGHGRAFEVFRADRVDVNFSLFQILKLKMIIENLSIEGARVKIREDNTGRMILPLPVLAGGATDLGGSAHIEVRRFSVTRFQSVVDHGETHLAVKDVNLSGSFVFSGGEARLELESGKGFLVDTNTPVSAFRATVAYKDGSAAVENLVVGLDRTFLTGNGVYERDGFRNFQWVFNPVDLRELSALGLLPKEDGELGGNLVIDGPVDSLSLRGSLTGKGFGLAVKELSVEGLLTPDRLSLSALNGEVFGSDMSGSLTYRFGEEGGFTYQGVCRGLDISNGFLRGTEAPQTDLNGFIFVNHSVPRKMYEFRGDLKRSTIRGFEAEELKFSGSWSESAGLEFQSLSAAREGFVLSGSGGIDSDGKVELIIDLKGKDPAYVYDYLALPELKGEVEVSGKLVGRTDRLQLNLNGAVRNFSFLHASVDTGQVQAQVKNIGSKNATGTVDLSGGRLVLGGREFSSPHVLIETKPGETFVKDFSFSKGDTSIVTSFEVRAGRSGTTIRIKHFIIEGPAGTWTNQNEGVVLVTERSVNLDSLLLESKQSRIGVRGGYAKDLNHLHVRSWGEELNVAVLRDVFQLPMALEGIGGFEASVGGAPEDPAIDLSLHIAKGVVDSLEFDRLEFSGGVGEHGYRVRRLWIQLGQDSITASGWWRFSDSPVRMAKEGFRAEAASRAPWSVEIRSKHFPLAPIFRALHRRVYVQGAFAGEMTVGNTPANPRISLAGVVSAVPESPQHFPPVTLDVSFVDSVLAIGSLNFNDGKVSGRLSGSIPVVIGLDKGVEIRRQDSIDLTANVSSNDLTPLSNYLTIFAATEGRVVGKIGVKGTVERPIISGTFDLKDCAFRFSGLEEIYRDVSAQVKLSNNHLELTSITGTEGKKGRFTGTGSARLEGYTFKSYQLALDFQEFELASISDFESILDGRLRIQSRDANGRVIPEITGLLKVKAATITREFGAQPGAPSPLTMPTSSPSWLCDVDIEAPKNVWVRNPDLNLEMGGNVILKRDQQGLYLRGELNVLRGRYSLYNNRFTITDGRFDFSTATTLRPGIYLNAYTPYRIPGEAEHRIYLSMSWPSDKKEPQIVLNYDEPGYSETDLWRMLGGQVVASETGLNEGGAWNAAGTAQTIATNYLERMLSAQMSDVTIDVESRVLSGNRGQGNGDRAMSIAIGRYLSSDLYLKYRQGLSFSTEREVDVEYRISNMFLLRSEIIRHSPKTFIGTNQQATDEINLDIRFRFEY